jgi:hypothetical protein
MSKQSRGETRLSVTVELVEGLPPILSVVLQDDLQIERRAFDLSALFASRTKSLPLPFTMLHNLSEDAQNLDFLEANGSAMGSAIEMDHGESVEGPSLRPALNDARRRWSARAAL